jgi:choline dehydrogenase-like flavoprotein
VAGRAHHVGSWRIAKDFPSLPGVDVQGGRRHDGALGRLLPALQGVGVPVRSEHGPIDGASLLDWPIGLSDLEPYYDKAEDRLGVTRTNGIPPSPPTTTSR